MGEHKKTISVFNNYYDPYPRVRKSEISGWRLKSGTLPGQLRSRNKNLGCITKFLVLCTVAKATKKIKNDKETKCRRT